MNEEWVEVELELGVMFAFIEGVESREMKEAVMDVFNLMLMNYCFENPEI